MSFYKHLLTLGHSPHGARVKYRYLLEFFCGLEQKGIHEIGQIQAKHLSEHYQSLKSDPTKSERRTIEPENPTPPHESHPTLLRETTG
jgi:hypothetical protein